MLIIFSGCSQEENPETNTLCGYNGEIIKILQEEPALIREVDGEIFLWIENGLTLNSGYLMDTIYLLKPCNLSSDFQDDGLVVIVSGEVLDNPPYSSHSNYTDIFITEIRRIFIR